MSSQSFNKKLLLHSLLIASPLLASAQSPLEACLTAANVTNIGSSSPNWAAESTPWQLRISVNPSAIAFPANNEQLASTIACARDGKVKVTLMVVATLLPPSVSEMQEIL